jgi:hypothetical protein
MTLNADFPTLAQLFGGYFNQDWVLDYGSREEAVTAFQSGESSDVVSRAKQELDRLTTLYSDESSLADVLRHLGCEFNPSVDGLTYSAWIIELKSALE